MRINKTTTEYIKGLVKAKAQPKIDALNASLEKAEGKAKALREAYRTEVQKVQEKATAEVTKLAKKFKIDPFHHINWRNELEKREPTLCFDEFTDKDDIITPFDDEISKIKNKIDELDKTIERKCTEVIARLSLGGTAADLDRLIAEIKF
jgi:predicted  nucleic acid-binding Zn-ribbon protein